MTGTWQMCCIQITSPIQLAALLWPLGIMRLKLQLFEEACVGLMIHMIFFRWHSSRTDRLWHCSTSRSGCFYPVMARCLLCASMCAVLMRCRLNRCAGLMVRLSSHDEFTRFLSCFPVARCSLRLFRRSAVCKGQDGWLIVRPCEPCGYRTQDTLRPIASVPKAVLQYIPHHPLSPGVFIYCVAWTVGSC